MSVDADAELIELRTVLRDLVALSAIPAAWSAENRPPWPPGWPTR